MNLTRINIENFKCFKSEQVIDIGRLTLLTGANSSGKSSLMYSILGTIQSGEFPYYFSTNGKYVNMGDFTEISFGHKSKNKIRLGFNFRNRDVKEIQTTWVIDPINKLPKLHELYASSDFFSLRLVVKNEKIYMDFDYEPDIDAFNEEPPNSITRIFNGMNRDVDCYNLPELIDNINPTKIENFEIDSLPLKIKHFGKYSCGRFDDLLQGIHGPFKVFDSKLNFISSFRLHPERTYLEKSKSDLTIEKFGEGYLDQIILWETKKTRQFKELIKIMKDLSLLEDIQSKRMDGGRYEMQVKTKKKGVLTSLSDVGFGVSQFLPT
jgi:AAA15 family ATPase/GTPase